jgi:class I fructose-bisphosphate aldolase
MIEPALWGPLVDPADDDVGAHSARVATELGADMVKVKAPAAVADLAVLIKRLRVPVFLMGGAPRSAVELATDIVGYKEAGATGIVFGRNIFTRPRPEPFVRALAELIHGDDVDTARKLLEGDEGP